MNIVLLSVRVPVIGSLPVCCHLVGVLLVFDHIYEKVEIRHVI